MPSLRDIATEGALHMSQAAERAANARRASDELAEQVAEIARARQSPSSHLAALLGERVAARDAADQVHIDCAGAFVLAIEDLILEKCAAKALGDPDQLDALSVRDG